MSLDASGSAARRLSQWPLRVDRPRVTASSPPRTASCWTPTTIWPTAFDLRMRLAARQVVTAAVFETPVGECELDAWFAAASTAPDCWCSTA